MKCGCVGGGPWECGFRRMVTGNYCDCICHELPKLGEPSKTVPGQRDWWTTVEWRPGRWDPMSNAPHGRGEEVRGRGHDGAVFESMHWASDLSGEEQPPFHGWFIRDADGRGFTQIMPVEWQPLRAAQVAVETTS